MSRSRINLLAAFALLLIAVSIFGRAAASREFSSLFAGAAGERSSSGARRANVSFQTPEEPKPKQRAQFTIYRNVEGEIVCRRATEEEIRERESINPNASGLRRINHFELIGNAAQQQSVQGTGLTIILRATPKTRFILQPTLGTFLPLPGERAGVRAVVLHSFSELTPRPSKSA